MNKDCKGHALHQATRAQDIPRVKLLLGATVVKGAHVLNGKCARCDASYYADHKTFTDPDTPSVKRRTYVNKAKYLKLGKSTWADRGFTNMVLRACYQLHASPAGITEFWNSSFMTGSVKVTRRITWKAIVNESI